jgi:branched-chain amino acid transport system permease protein
VSSPAPSPSVPPEDLLVLELVGEQDEALGGRDERPTDRFGGRTAHITRGSARWRLYVGAGVAACLAGAVLPVLVLGPYEARLVTRFVALSVALVGLQFVLGRAGMLSLCHGAFVGIGSYSASLATSRWGWSYLVGLALAPVAAFAAGAVVGLLALRIRATYLGPVTLAVAVAFPMALKRFSWLTGGSSGLPLGEGLRPPAWTGITPERAYVWAHLVVVLVAALALLAAHNLNRSPVGLAVRAVATGPVPATSSGVPVRRYRVASFGIGAAFGGVGGALLVLDTPIVGADSYDLFRSLGYYAAVVVGGTTAVGGAVVGAGLLTAVPWLLGAYSLRMSQNLVFGGLLLLVTFLAPGGAVVAMRARLAAFVVVDEVPPARPESRPGGSRRRRAEPAAEG